MDEYLATDHSVILIQPGEEGERNAKTNSAAAAHTKKEQKFS